MIVTLTVKWTRRTTPNPKAAAVANPDRNRDEWLEYRGVIFETLRGFPDANQAVREAIIASHERIERKYRNLHDTG